MSGFMGMDELIRDLGLIDDLVMTEAALPAALRTARRAVQTAKSATPVATGEATRSLHVGGHTELTPDFNPSGDRGWYSDLGKLEESRERVKVQFGSDLFYFPWIEDGGSKNVARHPVARATAKAEGELTKEVNEELGKLYRRLGF